MRIISKYKDYYDSVQSMGIDKSVVYERVNKETKFLKPPSFDAVIDKLYLKCLGSIIYDKSQNTWEAKNFYSTQIFLLGFCGKLYLGYNFQHFQNNKYCNSKTLYSANSVLEFINQIKVKHKQEELFFDIGYYVEQELKNNEIHETFNQSLLKQEYNDWFHHFASPIFMIIVDGDRKEGLRNEECFVNINPKLKDLDFFRIKDAFNCYQSIEQYITGILTNTEIAGLNMTNKEKIESHGFDMKYGFRTRPKNK